MAFYLIIFAILSIFSFWEIFSGNRTIKNDILLIGICTLFIVLGTIRWGEPADFYSYKKIFDGMSVEKVFSFETVGTEPLYGILNLAVKALTNNFTVFLFVEALIVNILFLVFIVKIDKNILTENSSCLRQDRGSTFPLTFMLMSWALGLWGIFIVRQIIAISICQISILFIRDRKPLKFFICVVIATLIHRSACIWILAYPIFYIKSNRWLLFLLMFVTFVLAAIFAKPALYWLGSITKGGFQSRILSYLNVGMDSFGLGYSGMFQIFKSVVNFLAVLVVLFLIYPNFKDNILFTGCLNLYVIGTCIIIVSCFTSNQFARAATPFSIIHMYLLTYLFRLRIGVKGRGIVYIFLICYLLFRLLINIRNPGYIPFETIFTN